MKKPNITVRAMSLVEVALAIGILSFCAVSLMGLIPGMLNTARESRETAVVGRIFQAVSLDVTENFPISNATQFFNQEGLALPDGQSGDYEVTITPGTSANLPGGTANPHIRLVHVTIENTVRGSTHLIRPLFIENVNTATDTTDAP